MVSSLPSHPIYNFFKFVHLQFSIHRFQTIRSRPGGQQLLRRSGETHRIKPKNLLNDPSVRAGPPLVPCFLLHPHVNPNNETLHPSYFYPPNCKLKIETKFQMFIVIVIRDMYSSIKKTKLEKDKYC